MKYTEYDIDDFLTDEFFIQWVKQPNENNRHFWEKWLEQHPEKREVVMQAVSIISSVHYQEKQVMGDRLYVEVFENILKADKEIKVSQAKMLLGNFSFPWRGMAASLLIMISLGMVFQMLKMPVVTEDSLQLEQVIIRKSNPAGKKSIITLSDGSKIYLNAASEISYASEFADSLRLVSLKGEAFFEVKQEGRPFVVEIDQTRIKVLGTSFNVNQRDNGALTVALLTGKVAIDDQQGNQMYLEPSEMMVKEKDGNLHKASFDPLEVTGWKDKVLVFNKSPLSEVTRKIENWFGVTVHLETQVDQHWSYSGVYRDESLENVLKGIFLTSGLHYDIEERKVVITNPK